MSSKTLNKMDTHVFFVSEIRFKEQEKTLFLDY